MYYAKISGWEYPMSSEFLILADVYDFLVDKAYAEGGRKGSKPARYPRGFEVLDADTERHKGSIIPLEEARNYYRLTFKEPEEETQLTDEILEEFEQIIGS